MQKIVEERSVQDLKGVRMYKKIVGQADGRQKDSADPELSLRVQRNLIR